MKNLRLRTFELRAVEDGPEGVVEGYITKFGTAYDIGWGLREQIEDGAFDDSLEASDGVIPIYNQHNHRSGGAPIGTGTVTRDSEGYKVRAELFIDTDQTAMSVFRAMKAGAIREWSVGFITPNDGDVERVRDLEKIKRGDLMEASTVLRGANPDTETLAVRSEDGARRAPEERAATEHRRELPAGMLDRIAEPRVRALLREGMTANDVRDALSTELRETYGTGEDVYIWLLDYADAEVWFEIYGGTDAGTYGQEYARNDADVSLAGEKYEVVRKTSYERVGF